MPASSIMLGSMAGALIGRRWGAWHTCLPLHACFLLVQQCCRGFAAMLLRRSNSLSCQEGDT